jgi:hypothetical protein
MCGENGVIMKSIDGGTTWKESNFGQYTNFYSIQFQDSLHGWAVGEELHTNVFTGLTLYTEDGGESWIRKEVGVGRTMRSVLFTDQDFGYVTGDDGSVLRWGENTLGVDNQTLHSPGLNLRNYPNPVNDATLIDYTIDVSSTVSLTVYNILGLKIANLVEANESAGTHHVSFNTGLLSPGIYICSLKANNTIKSIKIVKL